MFILNSDMNPTLDRNLVVILDNFTRVCSFQIEKFQSTHQIVMVCSELRIAFPREKRENKEFVDEEFLTRKKDEKNKELTTLIKIKDFGNI